MEDTGATVEPPLLQIPPEILLIIVTLLDVPDVLRVRQTCRTLCKITYERTIWVSLLQDQEKYLPLPPDILQAYREDEHVQMCSTSLIEESVVKFRQIAEAWPRLRSATPTKLKKDPINAPLMILKLFVERWLVAIYSDGVVRIYDTHTSDITLRASLLVESLIAYPSLALSIDSSGEKLILATSHSTPPYLVNVYQFNFADLPSEPLVTNKGFDLIQVLFLPVYKSVRAIEATERLLILATPSEAQIEIVTWDKSFSEQLQAPNRQDFVFQVNAEDVETLWDGVVAITFFGSHILVLKARSLEIYRYKDHASAPHEPPGFVLKHAFNMPFRDISFSEYSVIHDSLTGNTIYVMDLFACDVIQGLFHYTVRLSVPSPSSSTTAHTLPFLDVVLTSVYPLAHGVIEPLPTSVSAPAAAPHTNRPALPMTYSANFSPSPSFTHTHLGSSHSSSPAISSRHNTQDTVRNPKPNPSDYSSRGFVSAHCLGPQGKRGMWVERKRTSTVREVQVWSRDPPSSSPSSGAILASNSKRILAGDHARDSSMEGASPFVSEMERRVIYTIYSYDLRDDITMCAFGELSGTIALGHRSGEISVIKVEL